MQIKRLFQPLAHFAQALALEIAFGIGALAAGLFHFVLSLQFGQVAVDLCRTFLETRLRLGQLQRFHLRRVESLLRFLRRPPGSAQLALGFGQLLLGPALRFACRSFGRGVRSAVGRPVRRSRAGAR